MAKLDTPLLPQESNDQLKHNGYTDPSLADHMSEQTELVSTSNTSSSDSLEQNNGFIKLPARSRFSKAALGARSVRNKGKSSYELYPRRMRPVLSPVRDTGTAIGSEQATDAAESESKVRFNLRARNRYRNSQSEAVAATSVSAASLNTSTNPEPSLGASDPTRVSPLAFNQEDHLPPPEELERALERTAGISSSLDSESALKDEIEADHQAAMQGAGAAGSSDVAGAVDSAQGDFFAHLSQMRSSVLMDDQLGASTLDQTSATDSDFRGGSSTDSTAAVTSGQNSENTVLPSSPAPAYTPPTSSTSLSELGLSRKDLEEIEALRRRFSQQEGGATDESDSESISDLSARFGLGRLGQDQSEQDVVAQSTAGYTFEDLILTKQSAQGDFSDNSFNLSPTALTSKLSDVTSANTIPPQNLAVNEVEQMQMNISQNESEIQSNELQFKAGFLMQAHLPGSILYNHSEGLVYVDPSAASLLGLDFVSNKAAKPSEEAASESPSEYYPSRRKFRLQSEDGKSSASVIAPSVASATAALLPITDRPKPDSTLSIELDDAALLKNTLGENSAPPEINLTNSGHHFNDANCNCSSDHALQFVPYSQSNTLDFGDVLLPNKRGQELPSLDQRPLSLPQGEYLDSLDCSGGVNVNAVSDSTAPLADPFVVSPPQPVSATELTTDQTNFVEPLAGTLSGQVPETVTVPQHNVLEKLSSNISSLGQSSKLNHGVPYLQLLRILGRDFTSKLFKYLRYLGKTPACLNPLKCQTENCPFGRDLTERKRRNCPYVCTTVTDKNSAEYHINHATDSINFEMEIKQGNNSSFLYIRATAFYDPQNNLLSLSFSLSQQASRYFALLPNVLTDNAICDWDVPSEHYCFSPNYYRMVGYPVNSPDVPTYVPDWINSMVHPEDLNKIYAFHHRIRTMRNHDCFEIYYRLKRADGNYFWCKVTGVVLARDAEGNAMHIIGAFSNINHVVDSYEKIRNKIYTDVLTGLKNRAYMQSRLSYLLHPAQQPLGIIFVDATALKLYNDYLSHTAGDRLLITLTSLLNHSISDPKDLVRLSGDEFVCLIPNCNTERLLEIEAGIIESRRQYNLKAPVRMPVFFSFGSSVLDLKESLYSTRPHLLQLDGEEPLPTEVLNEAKELFYVAVQASDLQMQYYKRHNKQIHYNLIKSYIENILKYSISLNDSRMSMSFN